MIIGTLEERLAELKEIMHSLRPKTASQSPSLEYMQIQTYILGFEEAARMALMQSTEVKE